MKILILNPWPYTVEGKKVHKISSLKDTMIIGLATEFSKVAETTLFLCEDYRPLNDETYSFKVTYWKAIHKKIFPTQKLPYYKGLKRYLKKHANEYDVIICSEAFSLYTYWSCKFAPQKTIIWQEIAKHFNFMNGKVSQFYYEKIFSKKFKDILVVSRSEQAKSYISQYSNNVSNIIIDHGVDTSLFHLSNKKNQFIIVSQLIRRKHVEKSVNEFIKYNLLIDSKCQLFIIGDGEERSSLENIVRDSKCSENIHFLGNMSHLEMIKYLSSSLALLIYTERDNSLISIVEALASGTPVITNSIPYNSTYIKAESLGIVKDNWTFEDMREFSNNKTYYISNCNNYRTTLDYSYKVEQFLKVYEQMRHADE